MAAFSDFIGDKDAPLPIGTPKSPMPQQSPKASASQVIKTTSNIVKGNQPLVKPVQPQTKQSSSHVKAGVGQSQNKLGSAHQKLSQDSKASIPPKAASSSMVVKKEYARANASWANVTSVSPVNKPMNSVNRIPLNNSNKTSSDHSTKSTHSTLPGASSLLSLSSQFKSKPVISSPKSMQDQVYKRQSSGPETLFLSSNSNSTDKNHHSVGRFHSGDAARTGNSYVVSSGSTSKTGAKTGVPNSSMQQRVHSQHSPSPRHNQTHKGDIFLSNLNPSLFPSHNSPSSGHESSLRSDTPSPQKSPVSPSNAALSLYEQIQSQIRSQEAMEGQALKNLALAGLARSKGKTILELQLY